MIGLFQPEIGRRLSGHPITDKLVMAVNFANQDDPAASGSVVAWIPEDSGVAGPGTYLQASVAYAIGTNRYGRWVGFDSATLNSFLEWTRSDFIPTSGGLTVLLLYEKGDGSNRASVAFNVDTSTPASYCHATLPYADGVVYFAYGGNTAGVTRLDVSGLSFTTADRWVFSKGGRGMEVWQNGILRGSNGVNPTRTATPTSPFKLGAKSTDAFFSDVAHYNLFAMWGRQLTQDEILMVSADPYMLWEQSSDVGTLALLSAAAGSVAGGAAHPVGIITQLMPMSIPGRRYGSFAGKAGGVVTGKPWLYYATMRAA